LKAGIEIHCLRDLTRGGLTSALNEIAEAANRTLLVEEKSIPVREDVHAACEILGLDPFQVACEGRFAAFVAAKDSEARIGNFTRESRRHRCLRDWQSVGGAFGGCLFEKRDRCA
jgi:hydrogenase expression/formation protein HypE